MPSLPRRARTVHLALTALLALALGLALAAPSGAVAAAPPTKADVRVTLDRSGQGGQVISARPACESNRTVALFLRFGRDDQGVLDETQSEANGRYTFSPQRGTGGGAAEALAVAVGDARCRVAQSAARPLRRAQPAQVRVSLKGTVVRAPHGRVTSKRAGCFRAVTVHFFGRLAGSRSWSWISGTTTDEDGRYELPRERRRTMRGQLSYEYTTIVLGTGRCAVAQSGVLTPAS